MTRAEKIFEKVMFDYQHNDFDDPELQMIHEAMKQAAWEAWSWMSECASALEGHQYEKEKDAEIFEQWWNEELKENDK